MIRWEHVDGNQHPWRMTNTNDDELYAELAKSAGNLLGATGFQTLDVCPARQGNTEAPQRYSTG